MTYPTLLWFTTFASFVVEVEQKQVEPLRPSIGIDLGIKTFAFPSVGKPITGPDYKKLNRKIARFNRKLARQQKGSNRWQRTKLHLARLHLKVKNIRNDFLHKTSTTLVRENQVICLEDLNVKGMVKNRRLARAISAQGWGMFRTMCEAKAIQYKARRVSVISRWEPTSQICSDCGFRWGKIDLSIRSILCISCGAEHDRDENAAKNIDNVGAGLAHDVKRTMNLCKSGMPRDGIASSNQPYKGEQLCLSF